jgi:hypothetical protein
MLNIIQPMTISEFWEFAQLPENRDKRWERINGMPIEKGRDGDIAPSNKMNSVIAVKIVRLLDEYAEKHHVGYVSTLASEHRLMVDRYERYTTLSGGDILPDFSLQIARIFPDESE